MGQKFGYHTQPIQVCKIISLYPCILQIFGPSVIHYRSRGRPATGASRVFGNQRFRGLPVFDSILSALYRNKDIKKKKRGKIKKSKKKRVSRL
jgi:hypothetical protein